MPNISQSERDRSSPVWDMSQERAFMEQLMNQRINFFLILFVLIMTGTLNSKKQLFLQIILGCGSVLCTILMLGVFRATQKVNKIIKHLKKDDTHPISIIDKEAVGVIGTI